MPSASMLRLMNNARVRIPGAIDGAIQLEMAAVFDEFLTSAPLWWENISFSATATTQTYEANPAAYTHVLAPSSGEIVRLEFVTDLNGNRKPATMPTIPNLVLGRPPSTTETWEARVHLKNAAVDVDGYPVVPDWIVDKYEVRLLDGILGRMMSQVAKPYSSMATAAVHLKMFRSACLQARKEARHQNLYGAQRWSFPQTFNRVR